MLEQPKEQRVEKSAFGCSNAIDGKRRAKSLNGLDWCNTQLWSHLLFGVHLLILLPESTLPIQRPQCVRNANVDFLRTGRQMSPRFSLSVSLGSALFFLSTLHIASATLLWYSWYCCTFYLVRDWFILHILWWVLLYHFYTWADRKCWHKPTTAHKAHNRRLAKCKPNRAYDGPRVFFFIYNFFSCSYLLHLSFFAPVSCARFWFACLCIGKICFRFQQITSNK